MEPLQPFLAVGAASLFAVLAAWNVLERRRYAPKNVVRDVKAYCREVEGDLKKFRETLQGVVDKEESRRLENVKLRREFLDLIDQEEEVLGRIDTKNRRIQSAEARARQREGGNGADLAAPPEGGSLLAQIRANMRSSGQY